MRFALSSALLALAGPAIAADEGWREFVYPESGFAAEYPSRPNVSTRDYHTAMAPEGAVKERVYSVNSGGVIYEVAVADFSKSSAQKDPTIEEASKAILAQGKMTHDES